MPSTEVVLPVCELNVQTAFWACFAVCCAFLAGFHIGVLWGSLGKKVRTPPRRVRGANEYGELNR